MFRLGGWYWFSSGEEKKLDREKCGKWMHFFEDQEFAIRICEKAIAEKVCFSCKCRDMENSGMETGVICFYLNGDDLENHKRVIKFMLENNLICKTKTGRYYNISFKFDNQTRARMYGSNFKGEIKLSQFIDLNTGEWLDKG